MLFRLTTRSRIAYSRIQSEWSTARIPWIGHQASQFVVICTAVWKMSCPPASRCERDDMRHGCCSYLYFLALVCWLSLFRREGTVALFKGLYQLSHGEQGTKYQQKQNGALDGGAVLSIASDEPHHLRHHGQPPFLYCQLAKDVWHERFEKWGKEEEKKGKRRDYKQQHFNMY